MNTVEAAPHIFGVTQKQKGKPNEFLQQVVREIYSETHRRAHIQRAEAGFRHSERKQQGPRGNICHSLWGLRLQDERDRED